ncbi:MAG TPA: hypothetical protein ENI23_00605 [bacterium]|nr:hypothetical protein [bacterium]
MNKIIQVRIDRLLQDGAIYISHEKRNQSSYVTFKCKCGNIQEKLWSGIKYQNQKACCSICARNRMSECSIKRHSSETRIIEFFKDLDSRFLRIIQRASPKSKFSERKRTRIEFQCKCGELGEKIWDDIKGGQEPLCTSCARLKMGQLKGPNHPRWNPNLSEEARAFGWTAESAKWSRAILRAADWTCQLCNKRGTNLSAHHLFNSADHPDKKYDRNNGISICREHHLDFHSIHGYGNNTPEQFQVFASKFMEAT